ncbi:methyl-accepting chemotaxis protein [Paenibacillus larvae]|nr:methyl-accepting chemotaxis protein [Paenibacillus larvae]MDT2240044.1 methyl-accepting chemotaxis protein [Paenibacillus larvae]
MLSLNASIEAARAGEAEAGALPLSQREVKKLAGTVGDFRATYCRIGRTDPIRYEKAITTMNQGVSEVEKGSSLIDTAGAVFEEISAAVEVISDQVREVSAATEQMSASSEEVSASMQEVV